MFKAFAPAAFALAALSCASEQAKVPPPADDQCGAAALQRLIGRPKSEIPATPAGATWRVTCTTCPVTMDYSPRRLNIFFDEASGVIREVKCG